MNKTEKSHSTLITDMKIIAHGADGFLLFPTKKSPSDSDALTALHTHVYYEFFFATDTPLTLVTESGAQSFTNSVVIVPPSVKHFSCGTDLEGYCIAVTAEQVKALPETNLLGYIKRDALTVLQLNEALLYYLRRLTAEDVYSRLGKAKSNSLLQLIFLEIASLLSANSSALNEYSIDQKYRYVEKIERFINKNYTSKNATVENLAKELYLSKRQTSRIVKREFGLTFVALLNEKKLSVAAVLLKNTALPVSNILRELNFETENYFYRTFKKYYSVTPLQYRKRHRKAEEIHNEN